MAFGVAPQGLDDGLPMDEWLRRRNGQLGDDPGFDGADAGDGAPAASGPLLPMPFSVPDPDAGAWDAMVAQNRLLQAKNDPLAGDAVAQPSSNPHASGPNGQFDDATIRPGDPPARAQTLPMPWNGPVGAVQPVQLSGRPTLRPSDIGYGRQADVDADIAAGHAIAGLIESAGHDAASGLRSLKHWVVGQGPETPTSSDPATRWAEEHVGRKGYDFLDSAPDARGRRDALLGRYGYQGVGDPKCNQFVFDALTAAGAPPGRLDGGRIPLAEDWGNPGAKIGGYQLATGKPQPGDVVSDGHHVGLYSPLPDGRSGTVSAASPGSHDAGLSGGVVHNDWGFRKGQGPMTIWRRSPIQRP